MARTTKSPIRGNNWVPFGRRALLDIVKYVKSTFCLTFKKHALRKPLRIFKKCQQITLDYSIKYTFSTKKNSNYAYIPKFFELLCTEEYQNLNRSNRIKKDLNQVFQKHKFCHVG